jgi:hypothetical protein
VGSDEAISPENLLAFDRDKNLRKLEKKYSSFIFNPVNKPKNGSITS